METPLRRLRWVMGLPRTQRLESYQEREDTGACRWNNDQEHKQSQGNEDEDHLGGWRQVLEFLKHLFQVHGFPFLSVSGILGQVSWCRPLTGGSARSSRIAMLEQSVAFGDLRNVVFVV